MDLEKLRATYRRTEQLTLLLLLIALPLFGVIYLYEQSGTLGGNLPQLSFLGQVMVLGSGGGLLLVHYLLFHRQIKQALQQTDLSEKITTYLSATKIRFFLLMGVSVASSLGLLFSSNPGFVVLFALTLVFFSLGKPSPDRMMRLLKLKKQDRELLIEISRPAY